MEVLSEHIHIAYTAFFLHVWRQFVCSVGVLSNKISASELRRILIKSALLVGYCYVVLTLYTASMALLLADRYSGMGRRRPLLR